jgi:hypothetical protein
MIGGGEPVPDDPTIRAVRKQAHRPDTADAFLPDPEDGVYITADDAESFAEEFIATATTGEYVEMDALDEVSDDEDGGPYLELEDDVDAPASVPEVLAPSPPGARRLGP